MTRYKDLPDICSRLALDLVDRVRKTDWGGVDVRAEFGASGSSCSTYCTVTWDAVDADGDEDTEEVIVRFSNHAGGRSDVSLRLDNVIETITDDDGSYLETELDDGDYQMLLDQAFEEVVQRVSAAKPSAPSV